MTKFVFKTSLFENNDLYMGAKLYNSLPSCIRCLDFKDVKDDFKEISCI